MKFASSLFLAGSLVAVATPAMAQDSESTFTGFRVEALGGYDSLQAGSGTDSANENNDQSIDGFNYGIGVGYDMDLGGAVVGVEAELTDSTASTEFEDGDFEGFGFGNIDAGRDIYVGARVGAKVAPDVLLYAKGGYTNAALDYEFATDSDTFREGVKLEGFRVGGGAEYALNENTFVKLEYRYSNYQEGELNFDEDVDNANRFNVDVDRHQVTAGVGFRF